MRDIVVPAGVEMFMMQFLRLARLFCADPNGMPQSVAAAVIFRPKAKMTCGAAFLCFENRRLYKCSGER